MAFVTTASTDHRRNSPALPPRRQDWWPMLALSAWTLFVWGTRIRNIIGDDELTGWAAVWRAGLAGLLVALALALLGLIGLIVRRWTTAASGGGAVGSVAVVGVATGLAVVGSAVWLVRGIDITVGDHTLAFKAVHLTLAIVTLVLSGIVLYRLRFRRLSLLRARRDACL